VVAFENSGCRVLSGDLLLVESTAVSVRRLAERTEVLGSTSRYADAFGKLRDV